MSKVKLPDVWKSQSAIPANIGLYLLQEYAARI